jgi:hypothetical protein
MIPFFRGFHFRVSGACIIDVIGRRLLEEAV